MRLPRRVPWQTTAELEQLCSWIFTDENDLDSKLLAINKLAAWKAITSLPHALESTLAILSVIYQDNTVSSSRNYLSLRQSYATAIIRLVNGLVDPLQVGAYARSIASLAAQLGISPWLVELRHAATHEDLPSLEVLRESARQSMAWLLHNYFLPTINPSNVQVSAPPLRSLEPILKHYKNLMKSILRDASLANSHKSGVTALLRDAERWIAEAKVYSGLSALLDWETQSDEVEGVRERFALEKLCETLLQKGGLVPLSKAKRLLAEESFYPAQSTVDLWNPLISHVDKLHPDFKSVLALSIADQLLTTQSTESDNRPDDSTYTQSIARWANWIVNSSLDEEPGLKREVAVTLLTGLGPTRDANTKGQKAARALLNALEESDMSLKILASTLLADVHPSTQIWDPSDTQTMARRLETLLSVTEVSGDISKSPSTSPASSSSISVLGWRPLDSQNGWKPCPIGIYAPSL